MLFTLLLLQAQMALAGCMIELPDTRPAMLAEGTVDCHSNDSDLARSGLRHCEQTAEAPASSADRSGVHAADLPLVQRTVGAPRVAVTGVSTLSSGDPPLAIGPPVYLRLSRLLD
jgi:hypothetical protein